MYSVKLDQTIVRLDSCKLSHDNDPVSRPNLERMEGYSTF